MALKAQAWQTGDYIDYTNSTGSTIDGGSLISLGGKCALVENDIANGASDGVLVHGVIKVEAAAVTGSVGDVIYFDDNGDPYGGTASSGAATTTKANGDRIIGSLVKALTATDGQAYVALNEFDSDDVLDTEGAVHLDDSEALTFGTASDVSMTWDATNLVVTPVTDDTGAFKFGNGTKDMDVRITLGSAGEYIEFNVGDSDIECLVPMTFGVDDTGVDVKAFGATAGSYLLWDESADTLILNAANLSATGTITVGVDDTGHDVKFFGATTGKYMLWDESADSLIVVGTTDAGTSCEADAYTVGGVAGADFGPAAPASLTVVKGIVTAASS